MKKLLQHCSIIDGTGEDSRKNCWILIKDDYIEKIGYHSNEIPPDAEIKLNLSNNYVIPGMINCHVHIQRRHLHRSDVEATFKKGAAEVENLPDTQRILWAMKNAKYELKQGVTTIRDCGSKNRISIVLRDSINEGIISGPFVLACGFGIATTGGHETHLYQGAVEADGPYEMRKVVRKEIKEGADFIKFMGSGGLGGMPEREDPLWVEMNLDELEAGIQEAHNRYKKTTVHAMGSQAIQNAVRAGIDCIEHGGVIKENVLNIMSKEEVAYVPTISGIINVAKRMKNNGNVESYKRIYEIVINPIKISIKRALKKGIIIGCGTDTLGKMTEEIKILHSCGLSLRECIKAVTINGAKICGIEKNYGSIQCGQKADILGLSNNPLKDVEAYNEITLIMKNGEISYNDI